MTNSVADGSAGETFTSSRLGTFGGGVFGGIQANPEKIVRPFESFKERRDQALEKLRAIPGEVHEAELCWGRPSQLQNSAVNPPPDGGGFKTQPPKKDPPEPGEPPVLEWHEEGKRKVKKIRVENPDDPDQYVMVERIEHMYMRSPSEAPFGGYLHKWTFTNK